MNIFHGYTRDLPLDERLENERQSILEFLRRDPQNAYWQNRLANVCHDFDKAAQTTISGGDVLEVQPYRAADTAYDDTIPF